MGADNTFGETNFNSKMEFTVEDHIKKYQKFFNFMNNEHDLILTIKEMDEIIHEAQIFIKEYNEPTK